MKKLLFLLFIAASSQAAFAQESPKVIFHLQSSDTLVHKSIVSQISNLKKEFPTAAVEVLCHGPGIDFLLNKKSKYSQKIESMKLGDIHFVACEFTMSQRKIKKEDVVPFASSVPYGITEIVKKQQENWLYIKAGF